MDADDAGLLHRIGLLYDDPASERGLRDCDEAFQAQQALAA